jgi:cytoskeletal protein CcmA (bactofilin family)
MRKCLLAGVLMAGLFAGSTIRAGFVPDVLSYEGVVLDEFGKPSIESPTLRFSLLATNDAVQWQERHVKVPLTPAGAFQVLLGRIEALPADYTGLRLYVELNTGGSSWKELTPPQMLPSVVYALQADEARKAPGNLVVKKDLSVSGTLKATEGTISASQLNADNMTAGSVEANALVVSDVRGKSGAAVNMAGHLELNGGMAVKGSVALMKVIDLKTNACPTNIVGRAYLLANPVAGTFAIVNSVRVDHAAGGASSVYHSNLPGLAFFIPLDLQLGDKINFTVLETGETIPPSEYRYNFRTVQLVTIGQ